VDECKPLPTALSVPSREASPAGGLASPGSYAAALPTVVAAAAAATVQGLPDHARHVMSFE